MLKRFVLTAVGTLAVAGTVLAQTPENVEFGRDVLPIFRQNCVGCHGPSQQISGLRVDQRSSAMKGGTRRIVPGGSENSFVYLKLITDEYGLRMPPTGRMKPEEIAVIKGWIDQGAEWPDSLANDAPLPPVNPKAVAMIDRLRVGDRRSFMKMVAEDPTLLNARGPEGSTPFMFAVLYADAATVRQLLEKGADPNTLNDAKATALIWAANDLDETRVLLMHGAQVNVRSDDARTPLMIAAGRPGNAPVVKLLLERGANPNPSPNPAAESSPLIEAALAGDAESMQLLIDRGADIRSAGPLAFAGAVFTKCSKCLELLSKNLDAAAYTVQLASSTAALGDMHAVRLMLDHGANVNTAGPFGRTPLMFAAVSDRLPLEAVKLLIDRGANVNATSASGQTALDIARLRGQTAIVDLLVRSGAAGASPIPPVLKPQRGNTIQAAVQRSLPLLQRTDVSFVQKAGCVSCHNESLTAMTVSLARKHGFRLDEQMAGQQVKANITALNDQRERIRQGISVPFAGPGILSYVLIGLDAERHPPDINTDAVAMYLRARQMPDGRWPAGDASDRPPLCWNDIGQTVLALRALQRYAPKVDTESYIKSVDLAARWLAKTESTTTDDRSWRLLGLAWAGKDKRAIQNGLRELLAAQRSDGGWSDIPSIDSTAYATGLALVALHTAGLPVSDAAYQRGVQFLLRTQLEDGSWYVKTRALGFQPYFETGFPHGPDQWISAAGTNWATMALTLASRARPTSSARADS